MTARTDAPMSTLLFERSLPRFAAARIASSFGSGRGAGVGPLRLVEQDAPSLPGEGWVHVDPLLAGICGSDLSTLDGRSSRYFEEIVSFPFVPGHEVVGLLSADAVGADGSRPGGRNTGGAPARPRLRGTWHRPSVRGLPGRARGELRVSRLRAHPARPADRLLRRHRRRVVDDRPGGALEPALRRARGLQRRGRRDDRTGGLCRARRVGRRHPRRGRGGRARRRHVGPHGHGRAGPPGRDRALPGAARAPGRRQVRPPAAAGPRVRGHRSACRPTNWRAPCGGTPTRSPSAALAGETATLSGGADVVIDCVGSAESISQSLSMVRPRGTVALVGMPGKVTIDLAPLWHREVRLAGAYAYGTESVPGGGVGASGRRVLRPQGQRRRPQPNRRR